MQKKKKMGDFFFFSDDFGLRTPLHSENTFAKKRYTSIVEVIFAPFGPSVFQPAELLKRGPVG